MNWLDRTVSYISPISGLRRQQARNVLARSQAQKPAKGRRFYGRGEREFSTISSDPNDARPRRVVDRLTILRLVAENPFAKKGLNAMLNSLIGWGITGAITGPKAVRDEWPIWIKNCDFYRRLDLYGLQQLWGRCMLRDGEVFIVMRMVKNAGTVPMRLQTFDKGMLAINKFADNIEGGIEYDAERVPVAYHFYLGRPGRAWASTKTVRYPAEEVVHLFDQEWVGQSEGVSIFEPVVKRLGDIDEGIEAEVVKANIAACMVGFRYRPPAQDGEDEAIGMPVESDPDRPPVEEFVPGMIETLPDGEQITFSNPPKTGGIGELARIGLLASAAGLGVTYEQLTGDLSNVNFSSYRAGALEFKRYIGRLQYLTFIPVCLDRIFDWFMLVGWQAALFNKRTAAMKWTPPPFESIDREGDAMADILEMEAGLESRPNLLNSRGYDQDEMFAEIAASRDAAKAKKLAFKGDPLDPDRVAQGEPSADANRLLTLAMARRLLGLK